MHATCCGRYLQRYFSLYLLPPCTFHSQIQILTELSSSTSYLESKHSIAWNCCRSFYSIVHKVPLSSTFLSRSNILLTVSVDYFISVQYPSHGWCFHQIDAICRTPNNIVAVDGFQIPSICSKHWWFYSSSNKIYIIKALLRNSLPICSFFYCFVKTGTCINSRYDSCLGLSNASD